jgi:hypothetical protein
MPGSSHWSAAPGHYQDGHHGHFDNSSYPVPNLKRSPSDRSPPSTPKKGGRVMYYRRWPSESEITDSVPASEFPSGSTEFCDENDVNKLKGVRYPGMGLFDSADETQKRMRNQRKDDSVLKQMEETSSVIEPNEFIWAEDGEFQRVRDIYASPSIEGSPVSAPIHSMSLCHLRHENHVLTLSLLRTASLRIPMPASQSEVVVLQQQRPPAQFAQGPRPESLVRRQPRTSVPEKTTTREPLALVTPTTSSTIRRSPTPVCETPALGDVWC